MADGTATQTFDPDAFHQQFAGAKGFDPDEFHQKFTSGPPPQYESEAFANPPVAPLPHTGVLSRPAMPGVASHYAGPQSVALTPAMRAAREEALTQPGKGVREIARGDIRSGVSDVIEGSGKFMAPVAAITAPFELGPAIGATVGGTAAQKGTEYVAPKLGASPETTRMLSDVAGVVGGIQGSKTSLNDLGAVAVGAKNAAADAVGTVKDAIGRAARVEPTPDTITNRGNLNVEKKFSTLKPGIKAVASVAKMVGGPEVVNAVIPDHPVKIGPFSRLNRIAPKFSADLPIKAHAEMEADIADAVQQRASARNEMYQDLGSARNAREAAGQESPGVAPNEPSAGEFYEHEGAERAAILKRGVNEPQSGVAPTQPDAGEFYEQKAEKLVSRQKAQDTLDRKSARDEARAAKSRISIVTSESTAPTPVRLGSEGRPATWTNERVMELARTGNRDAIAQATRRGLKLPENARYIMGDADFPRSVQNPREVTKFTPEGTAIRDLARPTAQNPSSRARIQIVGDSEPPQGSGASPAGAPPSMAPVPVGPASSRMPIEEEEPIAAKSPETERRQSANAERRRMVSEMSPEEMRSELLTSKVTDLPNRRAFDEAGASKAVGMSDADGLKAFNDKFGYDAGNALLKAKAEALKEAGLEAYHDKGDEFLFRGESPEELGQKLERAREILRKNKAIEVTMDDGTVRRFKGADFSYGNGKDISEAETGLKAHKAGREARGERARGELRGITEIGPEEGEVDQGVRHKNKLDE